MSDTEKSRTDAMVDALVDRAGEAQALRKAMREILRLARNTDARPQPAENERRGMANVLAAIADAAWNALEG